MPLNAPRRVLAVAICATLAACARVAETPQVHEATQVMPVDAAAARDAISAYRRAHGLAPVVVDLKLEAVAQAQANAMAAADRLSHEVQGPLAARLAAAHLPDGYAVENVSAGYASFDAALGGWRRSPGHDANLRDPPMRRMGIAAAVAPGTRYKTFWALVMTD